MAKNIRRGRMGTVLCASCGQKTRRDRAVYMYKEGMKAYYCPDCAKKIHNSRLFKGIPRYARKRTRPAVRRKFSVLHPLEETDAGSSEAPEVQDTGVPDQKDENQRDEDVRKADEESRPE